MNINHVDCTQKYQSLVNSHCIQLATISGCLFMDPVNQSFPGVILLQKVVLQPSKLKILWTSSRHSTRLSGCPMLHMRLEYSTKVFSSALVRTRLPTQSSFLRHSSIKFVKQSCFLNAVCLCCSFFVKFAIYNHLQCHLLGLRFALKTWFGWHFWLIAWYWFALIYLVQFITCITYSNVNTMKKWIIIQGFIHYGTNF